jgi:hypothetical protein
MLPSGDHDDNSQSEQREECYTMAVGVVVGYNESSEYMLEFWHFPTYTLR